MNREKVAAVRRRMEEMDCPRSGLKVEVNLSDELIEGLISAYEAVAADVERRRICP